MFKQVIIVRSDLDIGKGKLAAQVAHASVEAVLKCLKEKKEILDKWLSEGAKKIVLKVNNLDELLKIYEVAKREGIITALIKDAGLTQLPPGTITCIALGPDCKEKIDKITKDLKLL